MPEMDEAEDRHQRAFERALLMVLEKTAYTNIYLHFPHFLPEDVEMMIDTVLHTALAKRMCEQGRSLPVSYS